MRYDLENWRRLAEYLNSDNYENVHVLNRIQIINDAINALSTKNLPHDVFRAIFSYLSRETDPLPWMAVHYAIDQIERIFDSPESNVMFKPYMEHLLRNNLQIIGYKDQPEDSQWTRYRNGVIKSHACKVDIPECYGNATVQLAEYLKNPDPMNITTAISWQKWIFCYGLRRANQSTWNGVLDLYVKTREKSLLYYLTCSENKTILENYLNMTLSEDSLFLKEDLRSIYDVMMTEEIGIEVVNDFYCKNIARIKSKFDEKDGILALLESSNGLLSRQNTTRR